MPQQSLDHLSLSAYQCVGYRIVGDDDSPLNQKIAYFRSLLGGWVKHSETNNSDDVRHLLPECFTPR